MHNVIHNLPKSIIQDYSYLPEITWWNSNRFPVLEVIPFVAGIISAIGSFTSLGNIITLTIRCPNNDQNLWAINLFCLIIGVPSSNIITLSELLIFLITSNKVYAIWYALRDRLIDASVRDQGCISQSTARGVDPSYFNIDYIDIPDSTDYNPHLILGYWIIASPLQREEFEYLILLRNTVACIKSYHSVLPLLKEHIVNIIDSIIDKSLRL